MNAIYPGTFDPFSLGHKDLVQRAANIYSEVTVAISVSAHKSPIFSFQDRVEMAKLAVQDIPNVTVEGFSGLLVDFMQEKGIQYVIRGIRGFADFEYEFQMTQVNRTLLKGYEAVFLMPSEKYMVLSSSFIRELMFFNADVSPYLTQEVFNYIKPLLGKISK